MHVYYQSCGWRGNLLATMVSPLLHVCHGTYVCGIIYMYMYLCMITCVYLYIYEYV